jgi:hypothetical protein
MEQSKKEPLTRFCSENRNGLSLRRGEERHSINHHENAVFLLTSPWGEVAEQSDAGEGFITSKNPKL